MATRHAGMSIEILGDTAGVQRAINHLQMKLEMTGMAAFMSGTIYPFIRTRAQSRFLDEGDSASGRWAPLKESTQAFRRAGGFPESHPINKRTGELERYITGSGAAIVPTPAGVMMRYPGTEASGNLRTKVRTAQRGKVSPNTPPRPVLSIGIEDMNFTLGSLALYIQAGG